MSEISAAIYRLADKIAEEATYSDDATFRLDAFKALTQFFIGTTRVSGKIKDDEEEKVGFSMVKMREMVNGASKKEPS